VCSIIILLAFVIAASHGQVRTILIPSSIITALIAYGIYNKKSWTPMIVTLLAAFGIIRNVLQLPGETLISLIFIMILIFEIYFFNKKEVKHVFKAEKTTTFF
jgi:hypothetical protein